MNARVLIVEDEPDIAEVVVLYCQKEGLTAVWKDTGEEGLKALDEAPFDLVVLDIRSYLLFPM